MHRQQAQLLYKELSLQSFRMEAVEVEQWQFQDKVGRQWGQGEGASHLAKAK